MKSFDELDVRDVLDLALGALLALDRDPDKVGPLIRQPVGPALDDQRAGIRQLRELSINRAATAT